MDKWSGAIVGERCDGSGVSSSDAISRAGVEELLQVEDGQILRASLDSHGEVSWVACADVREATRCVMATSQMSSMLKDAKRVEGYAGAIARVIAAEAHARGRAPRVLDIGAGTGLLAALSARAGAARVDAFEQWPAMAAVARAVADANGFADAVRVHAAHSSSASGTEGGRGGGSVVDAPADVIVHEIVDSALLGEGMLPALRGIFGDSQLVDPNVVAIPTRARVWAQLVRCDISAASQETARAELRAGLAYRRTDWSASCEAAPVSFPVNAERFPFTIATAPFSALVLDLSRAGVLAREADDIIEQSVIVRALEGGSPEANAVLWWWDLSLDESTTLSTAPGGATHSGGGHWVQMMVAIPGPPITPNADGYTVLAAHNDTRISFYVGHGGARVFSSKRAAALARKADANAGIPLQCVPPLIAEPQPCVCGLHRLVAFHRRWALGEGPTSSATNAALVPTLRAAIDSLLSDLLMRRQSSHTEAISAAGMADAAAPACDVAILDASEGAVLALLGASSSTFSESRPHRVHADFFTLSHSGEWAAHIAALVEENESLRVINETTRTRVILVDENAIETVSVDVLGTAKAAADDLETSHADEEGVSDADEGTYALDEAGDAEAAEEGAAEGTAVSDTPRHLPVRIDALVCDPTSFTAFSSAPLWFVVAWARRCVSSAHLRSDDAVIFPARARIVVQAAHFDCFADSFGAVGSVCGFDHAPFDAEIGARHTSRALPVPLWAERVSPASEPTVIGVVDFSGGENIDSTQFPGFTLSLSAPANSLIAWVDWELVRGGGHVVSMGPRGGLAVNAPTPHRQTAILLGKTEPAGARINAQMLVVQSGELEVRVF